MRLRNLKQIFLFFIYFHLQYTLKSLKIIFKLTLSGDGKAAILKSANEETEYLSEGPVVGWESALSTNERWNQYKSRYS